MGKEERESIHTANEGAVQRVPQQGDLTRSWKRKCDIVLQRLFPYYMEENLALSSASSLESDTVGWTRVVGWLGAAAAFPLTIFLMIE